MKKDNLEQFIINNREDFDSATPNPKLWAALDKKLLLMKKDNLEEFIINNREAFDTATPKLKLWAELDKKLPKSAEVKEAKRFSIQRILSVAAVGLLLIGIGTSIGFYVANAHHKNLKLSDISPEYAETEQYYKDQVAKDLAKLVSYKAASPEIQKDLQELDAWMQELQQELSIVPKGKQEEVINDIIDLYKTKLNILEEVLESVQSSNQTNNSEDETVDI